LFTGVAFSYAIKNNVHRKVFGESTITTFIDKSLKKNSNKPLSAKNIIGKKAPDFSLPLLEGGTMTLSDYEGKFVMPS